MKHSPRTGRYTARTEILVSLLATQGRRKDWLAMRAGVHPSLISHLIVGRRTVSGVVAEQIAAALQTPFSLLFDVSTDTDNVPSDEERIPA